MQNNAHTSTTSGLEEKAFLGGIGSFLLALPGMVIYFLLNGSGSMLWVYLGAALGGYLAVVLAVKGYGGFTHSVCSKTGIKISSVVVCVELVLTWYFSFCYYKFLQVASAFPEENVTFGTILLIGGFYLIQTPKLLLYLVVGLVFAMVAAGQAWYGLEKKKAEKQMTTKPKSLHRIDEEEEVPVQKKLYSATCKSCGANIESEAKHGLCPYCQYPY